MNTCRAIDVTTDPEDCDGWIQQVVDRNKKCCGAKSGFLGHLFESQKVSEKRIKEFANIEKLEVAVTLQEARVQATEIVYAGWQGRCVEMNAGKYDEVSNRVGSTQVNTYDCEDVVLATLPIKASTIMLSMAATNVNVKVQHHSTSDCWRSMTTWNEKDETHKCWEEVKSILTGEQVIGIRIIFVLEKTGACLCSVESIFL